MRPDSRFIGLLSYCHFHDSRLSNVRHTCASLSSPLSLSPSLSPPTPVGPIPGRAPCSGLGVFAPLTELMLVFTLLPGVGVCTTLAAPGFAFAPFGAGVKLGPPALWGPSLAVAVPGPVG